MPILILKFKDQVIDKYVIESDQTLTIGRHETNDIVIDNLSVSNKHARIDSVSATFLLTDLQSTNGTFVNEKLISAHHLRHQDEIIIGKHRILFDATDLEKKLDDDFLEPLQETTDDSDPDKTRYLDTAEYKDLIQKARKDLLDKE